MSSAIKEDGSVGFIDDGCYEACNKATVHHVLFLTNLAALLLTVTDVALRMVDGQIMSL